MCSLPTTALSWRPIPCSSLNQVRSVVFIVVFFISFVVVVVVFVLYIFVVVDVDVIFGVLFVSTLNIIIHYWFALRDVASGGIRRLPELRGLPSLASLPLHRLRHPLPRHARHQRLPLLRHDLLLQQALQGGEGGQLLGGL